MTTVYGVFAGAPNLIQSLFWLGGSIPYTLPFIVLTFYLGFFFYVLRRHSDGRIPIWAFIFTGLAAFTAGGLSEVYALFQSVVLGLILIILGLLAVAPSPIKRSGTLLLVIGIVFSTLALVIILVAPGRSVREAGFGETLPIIDVILRTLQVTASFFATDLGVFATIPLLVALILPAVILSQFAVFEVPIRITPRRTWELMALSLGIALVLVLVTIVPPIYATSVAPAPRVYLIPHLVLICTAGFWGSLIGLGMKRNWSSAESRPALSAVIVLALLVIAGPFLTAGQTLGRIPAFSTFAAEWDQREHDL
jgi:hypothetical protein